MDKKFTCLENLCSSSVLNENEKALLLELTEYVHYVKNDIDAPVDMDMFYLFAKLVNQNVIKNEDDLAEWCLCTIFMNTAEDEGLEETYEKYPLSFTSIERAIEELTPSFLYEIHQFYLYNLEDEKNAFKYALLATQAEANGRNFMRNVNEKIHKDYCKVYVGDCYMNGTVVGKDFPKALYYFLSCRSSEDTFLYEEDPMDNRFVELFNLLKYEVENNNTNPGICLALAIMYKEGIGTEYDYDKYKYYDKLSEGYDDLPGLLKYYNDITINANQIVDYDDQRLRRCNLRNNNKEYIEIGKYNHRSLLWQCIKEKNDKVLLLSMNCIESKYVAEDIGNNTPFINFDNTIYSFLELVYRNMFIESEKYEDFEFEEIVTPTSGGYHLFIPSWSQVCDLEDKNCLATPQAEEHGVVVNHPHLYDDDNLTARWFINDGETFVNIYGENNEEMYEMLCEYNERSEDEESEYDETEELNYDKDDIKYDGAYYEDVGIRPAMWIKKDVYLKIKDRKKEN